MNAGGNVRRADGVTAAVLALALLLGGMPLTLGIAIHGSEAMFALDICHPAQSFTPSAVTVIAVVPAAPAVVDSLPECGAYAAPAAAPLSRPADAPDPPPPK